MRARVERELARGASQAGGGQRGGGSPRTIGSWLASGRVTRPSRQGELHFPIRELESPEPAPPPRPMTPQALQERLEQAEPGLVAAIIAATQRGSWQAAAWMLERSFPERW